MEQTRDHLSVSVHLKLAGLLTALLFAPIAFAAGPSETADLILLDEADTIGFWSGAAVVTDPVKSGAQAARLVGAATGGALARDFPQPASLHGKSLAFWMHSRVNNGAEFMVCVTSPGASGDGDYYYSRLKADWEGWREIVLPLESFKVSRSPAGWYRVTRPAIMAHGWGIEPKADSVWHVDRLRVVEPVAIAADAGYGATPMPLAAVNNTLKFPVDGAAERIYGITVEVQGDPGYVMQATRYETHAADGSPRQSVNVRFWDYPFYRVALGNEWQTLRVEAFTKRGAASLSLFLGVFREERLAAEPGVLFRNAKVAPGGFPEDPPVPGAPYLEWINGLRANPAWAAASPFFKPAEVPHGFADNDLAQRKAEVEAYLELPLARLAEIMPEQRFFGSWEMLVWMWDKPSLPWTPGPRWDPREPDTLRDEKGEIVQPKDATLPETGVEEVVAPSGRTVRYPYHDPSPAQTPVILGEAALPSAWRVF